MFSNTVNWLNRTKSRHLNKHIMKSKGKGSKYSITKRRVPELIPVLGSQPAGDVSQTWQ